MHAIHVYTHALIMHIGFLACFHAISLERSHFSEIATFCFLALVALKLLVSLISRLVACSARIVADRRTHRTTTVTLAAHARRGLTRVCDPYYLNCCTGRQQFYVAEGKSRETKEDVWY